MTTEVVDAPTLAELGITWVPDHTQLPETDGSIVQNFQEHPQSILLTDSITPMLRRLHPDEQYCVGQDSGIYWNLNTVQGDDPVRGAVAPDWFYVANVAPTFKGRLRRSYVMWQEIIAPLIAIEFVSGDGDEERDRTPYHGKFWIYENAIRIPYYAIYEVDPGQVEVYHLIDNRYELLPANDHGHYPIGPMGVELGIWRGHYLTAELPWLRWWGADGNLLPTGDERAEQEHQRAEQEHQRAEQEHQRAERLAARLRALGVDPEADSGI
jgi:Uma2 family endonuclease